MSVSRFAGSDLIRRAGRVNVVVSELSGHDDKGQSTMTADKPSPKVGTVRERRLAQALRANLRRRKDQARSREEATDVAEAAVVEIATIDQTDRPASSQ